ncbi:MAG TPA: hypothetical protein VGM88_05275 [Kofleriaceae bacterium]
MHVFDNFGVMCLAMFPFAIVSGVIPLVNSEAALAALAAGSVYAWPKLLVLAVIVALGQSVTHASALYTARGLATPGKKPRPRLEARVAQARALGERWKKSKLLLIVLGATVGFPPQLLIALLAGLVGIRPRTFILIDVPGRIARFVFIVLVTLAIRG